ncbi:MAG: hypothetical protein K2F77_03075, partial [Muribaculaceae bacterium]|nr:hypothetical protein [Muribaculaceae bacterium]
IDGWPVFPFLTKIEGFNETYSTLYLNEGSGTVSFTLPQEDVALMLANGMIFQGDGLTINKVYIDREGSAGIADITADENAPVEYFNLQGIRVAEPQAGQFVIRRQGSKVTKLLVK